MHDGITIKQASELIGVTQNTLRAWCKSGKLKPVKTSGGHRRYSMQAIQQYLAINPRTEEEQEEYAPYLRSPVDEIAPLVEKYKEHLKGINNPKDQRVLATLMDSQEIYTSILEDPSSKIELKDIFWLFKEAWRRSRFLKLISVQPMMGPSYIVNHIHNNKLKQKTVVADTRKTDLQIHCDYEFDKIKDLYADQYAKNIDIIILENLPHYPTEKMKELQGPIDYVIAPEMTINELKDLPAYQNTEFFQVPVAFSNSEDFEFMQTAGTYVKNDNKSLPMFCPYLMFTLTPKVLTGVQYVLMRYGWAG